jgi:hypothetical protein
VAGISQFYPSVKHLFRAIIDLQQNSEAIQTLPILDRFFFFLASQCSEDKLAFDVSINDILQNLKTSERTLWEARKRLAFWLVLHDKRVNGRLTGTIDLKLGEFLNPKTLRLISETYRKLIAEEESIVSKGSQESAKISTPLLEEVRSFLHTCTSVPPNRSDNDQKHGTPLRGTQGVGTKNGDAIEKGEGEGGSVRAIRRKTKVVSAAVFGQSPMSFMWQGAGILAATAADFDSENVARYERLRSEGVTLRWQTFVSEISRRIPKQGGLRRFERSHSLREAVYGLCLDDKVTYLDDMEFPYQYVTKRGESKTRAGYIDALDWYGRSVGVLYSSTGRISTREMQKGLQWTGDYLLCIVSQRNTDLEEFEESLSQILSVGIDSISKRVFLVSPIDGLKGSWLVQGGKGGVIVKKEEKQKIREQKRADIMKLVKPAEELEPPKQQKVTRQKVAKNRYNVNNRGYFKRLDDFRVRCGEILSAFDPEFDSLPPPTSAMCQVFFEECCRANDFTVPPGEMGPKVLSQWKRWYELWSNDPAFRVYDFLYFVCRSWNEWHKKMRPIAWSPNPIVPIVTDVHKMTTFMGEFKKVHDTGSTHEW